MHEPVVDSVDAQSAEDDLVSGLIDDCAGHLEKNNLWDGNTNSSIKHFSDIYNIASQVGDDDDDDSLSFDRLLGHARLEKSPMESWIAAISSSDAETTAGINILANASVLRPLIPAAILPAGLLSSASSSLSQDQTLVPMVRPNDRVAMIPVIEHPANKLSFALARNELPGGHAPVVVSNHNLTVTIPSGQNTIPQTWTAVGNNGEANRTYPQKTQIKPARSRANRPKVEMSKPAMNEKESHELERVMDILKRYKQQLAEGDQIGQFLPCKRKRSKPPNQNIDTSSSSYSKSVDVETSEHERTQTLDVSNSKCPDKQSYSLTTASHSEPKPKSDLGDRVVGTLRGGDISGIGSDCRNNPSGILTNSAVYSAIIANNDSASSSFSPGNSYGATPPVSVLQCSPSTVDQASRCTSVGIDYQMEPPQNVARHQSSLAAAGLVPNQFGENIPDMTLVNFPVNADLEKAYLNTPLCLQRDLTTVQNSAAEYREETCPVQYSVSREVLAGTSFMANGETNMKPTKLTIEQIQQNLPESIPICKCLSSLGEPLDESKEGPYYTQLGAAESVTKIREMMEGRFGIVGIALRIEKIVFTGKEGKNPSGCPVAKWIIRRSSEEEKVLCLVRKRPGHSCETAVIVVGIVIWEGIEESQEPDSLYSYLTQVLSQHGVSTDRRCGSNDQKTCCCQGWDEATGGASFTFGCSWSMFYNGCKFAKSSVPRKFRLKKQQEEEKLERCLNQLASTITPLYAKAAPDAFHNQTQAVNADACRLGYTKQKPWSGVTAVVDYCTHGHKDINNMHNGCVAVVTLTKPRSQREMPEDEQLHILPLYTMDSTDEFGSIDGQNTKILSGAVECLTHYTSVMRIQQQKPNLNPRRNYRNKSKLHCGSTDKIQKKVAKVAHKRIRSSASRAARLNIQRPQATVEKAPETKDEKFDSQPADESTRVGKRSTEEEPNNENKETDAAEKQRTVVDGIIRNGQHNAGGTVSSTGGSKYDETIAHRVYTCTDTINVAQHQQTLESQICESVSNLTPHQLVDVMRSLNVWPESNVTESSSSQQVSTENLQVLWNLENGETAKMGIYNGNLWVKRGEEESGDLRNSDKPIQDDSLVTAMSVNVGFQSVQHTTAVSSGEMMASGDEQITAISREAVVAGESAVLPSSSSMLSLSSAYGEKCGGFLQLLNGDDDINYSDGCLNSSSEYCHHQFHHQQEPDNEKGELVKSPDDSSAPDIRGDMSASKNKPGSDSRTEILTKNEHVFEDSNVGGVAIALAHGSVLFEVAKREVHATTAVKNPNRFSPTRIALIFYQHKHLNHPNHGNSRLPAKTLVPDQTEIPAKDSVSLDERQTPSAIFSHLNVESIIRSSSSQDGIQAPVGNLSAAGELLWTAPVNNVHTLTTTTMVTKWIQPKLATSGPYQCWG